MQDCGSDFEQRQDALIQELIGIETFRRGSVNTVYRKCGKKGCACANPGHPGHGPMATLTFKEESRSRTRSIPRAAVDLVQRQIDARSKFLDWCNRWRELNEEMSDCQVQRLLAGESDQAAGKKKLFRTSSKKSGEKSKV
jgi:hypothetical protein